MKVVNEHLADTELSVQILSDTIGISRGHLHRRIKELTNQSASDFIRGIRLKQAADLLTSKKLSVSEVAYATGFSGLSRFSNAFKEFYGMTPTEYIAANSQKR
jgi:AraC-like DNA-binding protein